MNNINKIEFFDNFSCIGDKCNFTCCQGWKIAIDDITYTKWKSRLPHSVIKKTTWRVSAKDKSSTKYIKLNKKNQCPFLEADGLCDLITNYGEDFLSTTCQTFPRQENIFQQVSELSLSFACPSVVDLLNTLNAPLAFIKEGVNLKEHDLPLGKKINLTMLNIIQNHSFTLKNRLMIIFYFLLSISKELVVSHKQFLLFNDQDYLNSLSQLWEDQPRESYHSWRELNELFLDITLHYKKESCYKPHLIPIVKHAETSSFELFNDNISAFNETFSQWNLLIENYLVASIFASCISDDIDEIIMSYQIILTEYLMIKYSSFLYYTLNKELMDYKSLQNFIVIYSRIIGYNTDGIIEFWEDSFDKSIWEPSYTLLLLQTLTK